MAIPLLSLENVVDLGIHVLPAVAIALGWSRLRKLRGAGTQVDRPSTMLFSLLTVAYLLVFVGDILSLRSEALSGKILFSRAGLAVIYLNLAVGAAVGVFLAFRRSPVRWSLVTAAVLVAGVCLLDVVRAVDVGI
jgi:hypothetical protein